MRNFIWSMLDLAGHTAKRDVEDVRCHAIGSVGIRKDGTIVRSRNGYSRAKIPAAHAEARLVEKLDLGAVVFVARIRKSGEFGLAAPCQFCQIRLMLKRVDRVYFTTDHKGIYGCWEPKTGGFNDFFGLLR